MTITLEGIANDVVATVATELPFRTLLDGATVTVSSLASESENKDAVDVNDGRASLRLGRGLPTPHRLVQGGNLGLSIAA